MPNLDFHNYTIEKHKKNVLHSERRLAEEEILEGQVVKVGAFEFTVAVAGSNEQALGVALNTVTTAQVTEYEAGTGDIAEVEVEVAMIGVVPVLAAEEMAEDDFVRPAALGRVENITGDGTDNVIGKLLKGATGNGEETHMLIVYVPATSGRLQ